MTVTECSRCGELTRDSKLVGWRWHCLRCFAHLKQIKQSAKQGPIQARLNSGWLR